MDPELTNEMEELLAIEEILEIEDIRLILEKYRAKAEEEKEFGYYDTGKFVLKNTIEFLKKQLTGYNKRIKKKEKDEKNIIKFIRRDRNEIAYAISDLYGMLGGQYRRNNEYEMAIRAYDYGLEYEVNFEYQIANSYCLTNSIALRIINQGYIDEKLKNRIQEAISVIDDQVVVLRKKDWWAWADLGQLSLLNNDYEKSEANYKKFISKARSDDFESVIDVLKSLAVALGKNNRNIVRLLEKAIEELSKYC